ncbi:MAG: dienelactone hydrolase family protein [Stellaceae bacterium]
MRSALHSLALSLLMVLAVPAPVRADADEVAIPLIADGKPDPADTSVSGYLFRPIAPGRLPAVVLMHGCDGLNWHRPGRGSWRLLETYAARFVELGYVALALDSFAPRGVEEACNRPLTVSPERRAWDAFSAARYLIGTGFVDPDRLVIEGHSHGAVVVLVAMEQGRWHVPEHFAAGIAWYPGCSWTKGGVTGPILILIGDADEWTRADTCRRFADRVAAGGQARELILRTYPGAGHAFDAQGGTRIIAGHLIKPDPEAASDAWNQVVGFLRQRVGN